MKDYDLAICDLSLFGLSEEATEEEYSETCKDLNKIARRYFPCISGGHYLANLESTVLSYEKDVIISFLNAVESCFGDYTVTIYNDENRVCKDVMDNAEEIIRDEF